MLVLAALLSSFALLFTGCASVSEPPLAPPPGTLIVASASVTPAVGGVIPVYIEMAGEITHAEDICAVDQSGNCVSTLNPDEAARTAGGVGELAAAISPESAAGTVGRNVLGPTVAGTLVGAVTGSNLIGPASGAAVILGSGAGLVAGLARGASLASSPEARALDQIAIYSLGSRVGETARGSNKGFVYFPSGSYQRIRIAAEVGAYHTDVWLDWPEGGRKTVGGAGHPG